MFIGSNYQYLVNSIIENSSQQNKKYHLVQLIGSGGEGGIFKGKILNDFNKQNNFGFENFYAIKIQSQFREHESNFIDYLIEHQKNIEQKNLPIQSYIIRIIERFQWNSNNVIVMELGQQDLYNYIIEKKNTIDKDIICFQIAQSIKFLHSQNLMHRDIKPENFILVQNCFKLIDFGLIKKMSNRLQTISIGTPLYQSPELLQGDQEYAFPHDIWSLGCIFYEIYSGNALFSSQDIDGVRNNILAHCQKPEIVYNRIKQLFIQPQLANVIIQMLSPNPLDRPLSDQVVEQLNFLITSKQKSFQFSNIAFPSQVYKQTGNNFQQFKPNFTQSFQPNFQQSFQPNFQQSFQPNIQQSFQPNFQQSFQPNFQQSFQPNQTLSLEKQIESLFSKLIQQNYEKQLIKNEDLNESYEKVKIDLLNSLKTLIKDSESRMSKLSKEKKCQIPVQENIEQIEKIQQIDNESVQQQQKGKNQKKKVHQQKLKVELVQTQQPSSNEEPEPRAEESQILQNKKR